MNPSNKLFRGGTLTVLTAMAFGLVSCTSPKQVKEAVEKDPSIVFAAIEKDPKGFFEAIQKAKENMENQPLNPKIEETRIFEGPKSAKVTIVEYADFLCGHCANANVTMKQVLAKYPNDVRILFKNKPILHEVSHVAAKYFVALGMQKPEYAFAFKTMAFEGQKDIIERIKSKGKKSPEDLYKEYAKKVGADLAQLEKDLSSPEVEKQIAEDSQESDALGFQGTPGFVVQGTPIRGAGSLETFSSIIDKKLKN